LSYYFKPWTHWHLITEAAYNVLMRAGYEGQLQASMWDDPRG
jgi:hypothetical protein